MESEDGDVAVRIRISLFGFIRSGCYGLHMSDDATLLQSYVTERSEKAFAELVNRHLALVYRAALRQTGGDAHSAQDVAQAVFVDLARKANLLTRRPVLAGWLYTSTRYAAAQVIRGEQRRRVREEKAQIMNELTSDSSPVPDWNQLRPVIDDALHRLNERDREAVLLRFFEGKPFSEIGAKLAVSEDAARVRVDRALDKLRTLLSRRGVTSTSVALGTLLANEALAGAPAGLAIKITGAALASAAATGGATVLATFIGMTKLQIGLAVTVAVGGAALLVQQQKAEVVLRSEMVELRQRKDQLARLQSENQAIARTNQEITGIRNTITDLSKLRTELTLLEEQKAEADYYKAERAKSDRRRASAMQELTPEERPYMPIVRIADLDERPVPLVTVEPLLTPELKASVREQNLKATATMIIDASGKPRNIKVTNATTPEFEQSVQQAVAQWTFKPAIAGGKPVSTRLTIPFRMNKESPGGRSSVPAAAERITR